MSLSPRSSEENSGCRKYWEHTWGVIYFFISWFRFFWVGFIGLCHDLRARLSLLLCRALLRTADRNRTVSGENEGRTERASGQALVEVVVCAVGRVVILPLVEMTAQSTALLALVTDDGGIGPR